VRRPDRRQVRTLVGYGGAGAVYIAIGVTTIDFLLSVFVAAAYLVIAVWLVPLVVRRIV
jgi:hypothetical protein